MELYDQKGKTINKIRLMEAVKQYSSTNEYEKQKNIIKNTKENIIKFMESAEIWLKIY